jgi:hypothetical protein
MPAGGMAKNPASRETVSLSNISMSNADTFNTRRTFVSHLTGELPNDLVVTYSRLERPFEVFDQVVGGFEPDR